MYMYYFPVMDIRNVFVSNLFKSTCTMHHGKCEQTTFNHVYYNFFTFKYLLVLNNTKKDYIREANFSRQVLLTDKAAILTPAKSCDCPNVKDKILYVTLQCCHTFYAD